MNVLAIDAGNSRLKWGFADSGGWVRRAWLPTSRAAQIGAAVQDLPKPERIIVSNVAGEQVRDALTGALSACAAAPVFIRGREQQCGVKSGYADPLQLGSDRWAGLIAAWKLQGGACVVVNAGTTMTVDALSGDGVFLGGVIVPGLDLMRRALARGTAQLKLAAGAFCYFPDNTADAIMSGAINALAGTIERMRGYMTQAGQGDPQVLLSGGGAPVLQPQLSVRSVLVDNLVLDGLLAIVEEGS